ncbi:MAG: hypothetical protein WCH11_03900 [Bdellovibrio sp.]
MIEIETPKKSPSDFVIQQKLPELVLEKYYPTEFPSEKAQLLNVVHGSRILVDRHKSLQRSLRHLESWGDFGVSEELLQHFSQPQTSARLFMDLIRFDDWPLGLKWSLETLGVLLAVLGVSLWIPWNEVMKFSLPQDQQMVLSEFHRKSLNLRDAPERDQGSETESLTYPDEPESAMESNLNLAQVSPTAKSPEVSSAPPSNSAKAVSSAPLVAASPSPGKASEKTSEESSPIGGLHDSSSDTRLASGAEARLGNSNVAVVKAGFLYRGTISVTNVTAATPKFVEKIGELGGRKAGEVPLGWRKGSGSYFHLTIPESRYESLVNFLREYGDLKIQREKHERVMPEGILRLIIQVEEKY